MTLFLGFGNCVDGTLFPPGGCQNPEQRMDEDSAQACHNDENPEYVERSVVVPSGEVESGKVFQSAV